MRILHVMAGGEHGGAETACIDMVLAMHEAGQDVALATRRNPRNDRAKAAGISVYEYPFGAALDIYTLWALKRRIKKFKPDIVQTWMSRACAKTPAWNKALNIPRYHVVARLGGYYKLKYFKSADAFTTITPDIREYLIKNGVPPQRVRHINNFAETESVHTPIRRSDYGIPEDAVLLLGLGRLHKAKAFDVLIKAMANSPALYLWIAGEGPERETLKELIHDLKLEDRVKLLGWRDDRAALFQASDICVFCSRYEPFGTVFVQSWAQGVPVIVSDADGPRQFVKDNADGLIVPVDNQQALEGAIQRLASDQRLQKTFIQNGYERYRDEFTKKHSVAQYLEFYKSL